MDKPKEVTVRYLVQFDENWKVLRVAHENNMAPEYFDRPEGVLMLNGGGYGQKDFAGVSIIVNIKGIAEIYGNDSSQVFFSRDIILEEAGKVLRKWVLGFYETAKKAIDEALEEASNKLEIF